ncbi:hypothetical protein K1719_002344 [Acacia pycnantha]|nr:hypothetical protein K1719_002344 [Acacia pycnantha]
MDRAAWDIEATKILLDACIDQINAGEREERGKGKGKGKKYTSEAWAYIEDITYRKFRRDGLMLEEEMRLVFEEGEATPEVVEEPPSKHGQKEERGEGSIQKTRKKKVPLERHIVDAYSVYKERPSVLIEHTDVTDDHLDAMEVLYRFGEFHRDEDFRIHCMLLMEDKNMRQMLIASAKMNNNDDEYLLEWEARSVVVHDTIGNEIQLDPKLEITQRYRDLVHKLVRLARKAAESREGYEHLQGVINEAENNIPNGNEDDIIEPSVAPTIESTNIPDGF